MEPTVITGTVLNSKGEPASNMCVVATRLDGTEWDQLQQLSSMSISGRELPDVLPGVSINEVGGFRCDVEAPDLYRVQVLSRRDHLPWAIAPQVRWETELDGRRGGTLKLPPITVPPLVHLTGRIQLDRVASDPLYMKVAPSGFTADEMSCRLESDGSFDFWVTPADEYTLTVRSLRGPLAWKTVASPSPSER